MLRLDRVFTNLVARADDDMGATEEVGDGTGVGVEEALAGLGNALTAPVDLDELGERALRGRQRAGAG